MKRSEINFLVRQASRAFRDSGWALPPDPRWDVTDFGLGHWPSAGLVLVNLAEEPEYCEKLMFALRGMQTPAHCHRVKKEDIICRAGYLQVTLWGDRPSAGGAAATVKVNGAVTSLANGTSLTLGPGERVTLPPGVWHAFEPLSESCVIGEVSTANDDAHDNFFDNTEIGRYPTIEEDEPGTIRLVSDLS